jgi:sigma-B regulation protein RsbU (phosphoserine phosphatase)
MQGKRGDARITIDGEHSIVFYAPLEYTNWSMAIVVPEKVMLIPPLIMTGIMMLIIIVGLVVVWLFCRSNIRQITSPLGILAQSANEVAKGNFEAPLPTIVHKDEICKLRESFASMQQSLMTYVQDLTEKTAQEAALDRELQLARKLQVSMIPNKYPPYPERTDIDIYGTQKPAKVIGGDLFDFFIRDEQLFFCIGDVSGKGIPAALVMAVVHDSFRIISKHTGDPKGIVEVMNNYLSAENRSSMFCTFFLGVLDLKTHLLRYCNAGHELPILITDEVKMVPVEHNLALGLMEGLTYKSEELQLKPGDVIVVCTDGIKEATNQEEDCFEKERMKASLRKVAAMEQADAADYVHHLVDDVTAFVGDAPQADDLTMLAIKIRH